MVLIETIYLTGSEGPDLAYKPASSYINGCEFTVNQQAVK